MDSNQLTRTMEELLKINGSSLDADDQQLAWVIATTSPDPLAMLSCKMTKSGDEIIFEKPETPEPSIDQSTDPIVISFCHSISEQEDKLNLNKENLQKPLEDRIDQLTTTIENLQKFLSRFDLEKLAALPQPDDKEKQKIDDIVSKQEKMRQEIFSINFEMGKQASIYARDKLKWAEERALLEKELQHYKTLSQQRSTADSSVQVTQVPTVPAEEDSELLNLVESLRKQYKCVNCNESLHNKASVEYHAEIAEAGPKNTQQSNLKVEETARNFEDTLHISEQNKISPVPILANPQTEIQISTSANSAIDDKKRTELRLKFHWLLETHNCNSPNCTVAKFKDELKHAKICNGGPCFHDICDLLKGLVKHLKFCKNQVECPSCQPYFKFDEQKLYRMMVVLEEGCSLTSESQYDMTTTMRESVRMIAERNAVHYGLLDDLEDMIENQSPNNVSPAKDEQVASITENCHLENQNCETEKSKIPIPVVAKITPSDIEETTKILQNIQITEQTEPSPIPISADPALESQTSELKIEDKTTRRLQESFLQLIVNHNCQEPECCVITFKGYVEHAGLCADDSKCSWFICMSINAKSEHNKVCLGEAECSICQCYLNFKEVKILRMMDILEQGCPSNSKFTKEMTKAMKETITTMVARLAVNSGLIDRNAWILLSWLIPQEEDKTEYQLLDSSTSLIDFDVKISSVKILPQVEEKTDCQTVDAGSDSSSLSGDWEVLEAERRLEVD